MKTETINEAYKHLMQGDEPIQIREKLGLTTSNWHKINMSSLWRRLLLPSAKKETMEQKLNLIKGIELSLFNALKEREKSGIYSERYRKLTAQINQLTGVYSSYNIYHETL